MQCVIDDISSLVGTPFKDGGRGPDSFDCWGLVREVYKRCGIDLPEYAEIACYDALRVTAEMASESKRWNKHQPPDLPIPCVATFRVSSPMVNHVGVYIGNGKFLHTREKAGAVIESLDSPIWRHRIEGFYTPCKQT